MKSYSAMLTLASCLLSDFFVRLRYGRGAESQMKVNRVQREPFQAAAIAGGEGRG